MIYAHIDTVSSLFMRSGNCLWCVPTDVPLPDDGTSCFPVVLLRGRIVNFASDKTQEEVKRHVLDGILQPNEWFHDSGPFHIYRLGLTLKGLWILYDHAH